MFYRGKVGLEFVGFWTPRGVAVKFLRMLTPPLSLIVVLFLSLLLKTLWDCGKKSRNEGATIIHRGGIPDEGVIGSVGEEEASVRL